VGGRGGWVRGRALAGPPGRDSSAVREAVAVSVESAQTASGAAEHERDPEYAEVFELWSRTTVLKLSKF
jgi:hypothetical protein